MPRLTPEQLSPKLQNLFQRRVTAATEKLSQGRSTSDLPVYYETIRALFSLPYNLSTDQLIRLIDEAARQCGLERHIVDYSWDLPAQRREDIKVELERKRNLRSSPPTRPSLASSEIPCQPKVPTVIKGHIPPRAPRHAPNSDGQRGDDPTYTIPDA